MPALRLDSGEYIAENTAILPYLGKRFGLWPSDPIAEAKALSLIGFLAASVHPSHAHIGRPERYASDPAVFPQLQEMGRKTFHGYLKQIDGMLSGRQWFADGKYTVELNQLRRENRQLRLERDILAKAAAWFARETNTIPSKGSGS